MQHLQNTNSIHDPATDSENVDEKYALSDSEGTCIYIVYTIYKVQHCMSQIFFFMYIQAGNEDVQAGNKDVVLDEELNGRGSVSARVGMHSVLVYQHKLMRAL